METLTIYFNKAIKEKLMNLLSGFSEKDLRILTTEKLKTLVEEDYANYKSGRTELLNIDEVEKEMEDLISKNEN